MRKTVFSGIQPTGEIHIGNYLGAIERWVELARSQEYFCIFSIVDYHAITVPYEAKIMKQQIEKVAAMLMACGLNEDNCLLFIQSQVPEHTELAWILNSSCTMSELARMTQFKDKSQNKENTGVGLFTYPVLQTADIILYKATHVPVGEDQLQHLELAREIVRRFNRTFKKVFPEPQPIIGEAKRILGTDGGKKMSKSLNNTVALSDSSKKMWKKLACAKTDEKRQRREDPGVPTDCNVFMSYHKHFTSQEEQETIDKKCRNAEFGCVDCKKILAKNMEEKLGPIRKKYEQILSDPTELHNFLEKSAKKCKEMAEKNMQQVRKAIGLR